VCAAREGAAGYVPVRRGEAFPLEPEIAPGERVAPLAEDLPRKGVHP